MLFLVGFFLGEYFTCLFSFFLVVNTPARLYLQLSTLILLLTPLFPPPTFVPSMFSFVITLPASIIFPLIFPSSPSSSFFPPFVVSFPPPSLVIPPSLISFIFSFSFPHLLPLLFPPFPFLLSSFLVSLLPSFLLFRSHLLPFLSLLPLLPYIFPPSSQWGCQSSLCSPYDIIQCRLQPVCATVQALAALDATSLDRKQAISTPNPTSSGVSETPSLVSVTTQTPPPAWQIWDLIGSSLLHILCLVLLFVAYSWSELT